MNRYVSALTAGILAVAALAPLHAGAQVSINVNIGEAPPPVRYEAAPPPRSGYIWAPGYWDWKHHKHVWVGGHWERERVGYVYAPAEWRRVDGEWRLYPGSWHEDAHRHRKHHDDARDWHCPPGQAKKGRC